MAPQEPWVQRRDPAHSAVLQRSWLAVIGASAELVSGCRWFIGGGYWWFIGGGYRLLVV